jgi:hypothetical protein
MIIFFNIFLRIKLGNCFVLFCLAAEPSPGFNFHLAMYGDMEEEVIINLYQDFVCQL